MPRRLKRSRAFRRYVRRLLAVDDRKESEIAKAAGVDGRTWRYIKNEGRIPAKSLELERLCQALRCPVAEMRKIIDHGDSDTLAEIFKWYRDPERGPLVMNTIRAYYADLPEVLPYPAVMTKDMLARAPVALRKLDEQLKSDAALKEEEQPRLAEGYKYLFDGEPYSNFVRSVAPDVRQDNNFCYRMIAAMPRSEMPFLVFGPTRYRQFVNSCEALSFELGQWCFDHQNSKIKAPRSNGQDLRARGPAADIFDLRKRSCATGVCTVLILKKTTGCFFYLQERISANLMEDPGGWHIVPSGTFQPETGEDDNHGRDYSVERTVIRELAEELLGVAEVEKLIAASENFYTDPRVKPYVKGLETGAVKTFFLGVSMHPPSAKPDLMTAMVVDTSQLSEDSLKFVGNWEGRPEIQEVPISRLERWVNREDMSPTGATSLALVRNHIQQILQE
jgi:hypothetical protein